SGIQKEAKRVRWPKGKDIRLSTAEVILFTAFFALFFIGCDFLVTFLLRMIGIGA
ncbi:MAG: preprotein translocase subunit SecE, partial [Solobacterium sp.]|nr:preprotein translocase subunit SecE [Solobacterium sp.]